MHPKPRAEGAHKIEPAKQVQKNREHVSRFFYFEREKSFPGTFFRPCSAKSEHILSAKPQVLRQIKTSETFCRFGCHALLRRVFIFWMELPLYFSGIKYKKSTRPLFVQQARGIKSVSKFTYRFSSHAHHRRSDHRYRDGRAAGESSAFSFCFRLLFPNLSIIIAQTAQNAN